LVLANGSLDAEHLEPSVVFRNLQRKEFCVWRYLPGFDAPAHFLAGSFAHAGSLVVELYPLTRSLSVHQGIPTGETATPKRAQEPIALRKE
jgi:hypothetical protein